MVILSLVQIIQIIALFDRTVRRSIEVENLVKFCHFFPVSIKQWIEIINAYV